MQDFESNNEKLKEMGTIAVGVSVDSVTTKKAWDEKLVLVKNKY